MRNRFDMQLSLLNTELIKMGALCENAIANAAKALIEKDLRLTEKTFEIDREIDRQEREIESLCLKLLLQQQPVAKDLRLVSAALKMITDMERIGDQAADIAEIIPHAALAETDNTVHIVDMARLTIQMVTDSVDAFVRHDLTLASQVIQGDDAVDRLFDKIKSELVTLISKDPLKGESAIDLLMIAKYLERVGDHAVNIAEWVEFSITGQHKGGPL